MENARARTSSLPSSPIQQRFTRSNLNSPKAIGSPKSSRKQQGIDSPSSPRLGRSPNSKIFSSPCNDNHGVSGKSKRMLDHEGKSSPLKKRRKLDFPDQSFVNAEHGVEEKSNSNVKQKVEEQLDMRNFPKDAVKKAVTFLRRRLYDYMAAPLLPSAEENRKKLLDMLTNTIVQGCNNSTLLLGPRGCGKSMVLEHVVQELLLKYPERLSVVRLNGLIHADDRCALKEIARQLCVEYALVFSKAASFNENLHFLTVILREFSLSHKAIVFVLDEFDLFAQRTKQCLLYNLLDVLQSSFSQAAIVGLSCRLDADQLLEKRVRSRFSQRKYLFLPPSRDDITRLVESALQIPDDSGFPYGEYAKFFNKSASRLLLEEKTRELIDKLTDVELSPRYMVDFVFRVICNLDHEGGRLTISNFKSAAKALEQQPKLEFLADSSVLELCLLVSMKRLEAKECEVYNFNTIYKEYKQLQEVHNSCDFYSKQAALRAFDHLLERGLVSFLDSKNSCNMLEFRPVKLLISNRELEEGLNASTVCPVILRQWFSHASFK